MAMRETEGSLRTYLVLAGAVNTYWAVSALSQAIALGSLPASWMLAVWFPILTRIPISIGFVVAGLKLKKALVSDPAWILGLLKLSGVIMVINVGLTAGVLGRLASSVAHGTTIAGVLITWYLYANVNRLAREAKLREQVPTVPPARVIGA